MDIDDKIVSAITPKMNADAAFAVLDEVEAFISRQTQPQQSGTLAVMVVNENFFPTLLGRLRDARFFFKTHIASLESRIETLEKQIEKIQESYATLEGRLDTLNASVAKLTADSDSDSLDRKILVVRQVAYAYQSRLERFVSLANSKFSRTHSQVAQMVNGSKGTPTQQAAFTAVEQYFQTYGYSDTIDIENAVKQIRELGSDRSHPYLTTDGLTITEADVISYATELAGAGKITNAEVDATRHILEVVKMLSGQLGESHLLKS